MAVLFDPPVENLADGEKDEANKEQDAKPSIFWVDSMFLFPSIHMYIQFEYSSFLTMILFISSAQDIVHDHDTQAEDWHIAIEAFCEVICQTISFV